MSNIKSIISKLPNKWFAEIAIPVVEQQLPVRYIIPFGAEEPVQKTQFIHAFVCEFGGDIHLIGSYETTNGWSDLYSFSPENQTIYNSGSPWERSLWCIGDDTDELHKLEKTLHNYIKKQFGGIPIPSEKEFEEMQRAKEKAQKKCNCNKLSDLPSRMAEAVSSEILGIEHIFCAQCLRHHAIRRNGKRISDSTLFDPTWVLEETYEDVFAIPNTDDYVIYSTSSSTKRIHYTVDVLAQMGDNENREFTNYDPMIQNVLVYVYEDVVTGYLSVRQLADYDILHQLYVRPSMRGNRFATNLIESWNENVRETDTYLLDEPNEASRSIFCNLNHMNRDSLPRAVPASRLETFRMHD